MLPELLTRLEAALATQGPYEIVLVNDGSRDDSWKQILALADLSPAVHGINLMRNYGQHNAVLAGVRAATFDVVVTIDDDLQNPPEEIPRLLDRLGEGYDVVYGSPIDGQWSFWRNIASKTTKLALQTAMGSETARQVSAFRAFHTRLRDAFSGYHGPFVSVDVLLTWGTKRFTSVPVRHDPRRAGRSNYTVGALVSHALNMMTGFSVRPLQLASLLGLGMGLMGIVVLAYVVGRFLISGDKVPGFPFLASTIAIFSGAQLFAVGIIGEYLARMHFRLMQKPTFVIADDTRAGEDQ
jgi:undecaprenyl-phosphate 4-deoxy-4-formamido-L-arabinose transferase